MNYIATFIIMCLLVGMAVGLASYFTLPVPEEKLNTHYNSTIKPVFVSDGISCLYLTWPEMDVFQPIVDKFGNHLGCRDFEASDTVEKQEL